MVQIGGIKDLHCGCNRVIDFFPWSHGSNRLILNFENFIFKFHIYF